MLLKNVYVFLVCLSLSAHALAQDGLKYYNNCNDFKWHKPILDADKAGQRFQTLYESTLKKVNNYSKICKAYSANPTHEGKLFKDYITQSKISHAYIDKLFNLASKQKEYNRDLANKFSDSSCAKEMRKDMTNIGTEMQRLKEKMDCNSLGSSK